MSIETRTDPRLQPHCNEAEQSVLGAILLDKSALANAMEILTPQDFYKNAHGTIYEAMLDLSAQGQVIDQISLTEYLKIKGELRSVGGAAYLAELLQVVPSASSVVSHSQIVREHAQRRQIIRCAQSLTEAAYAGRAMSELAAMTAPLIHDHESVSSSKQRANHIPASAIGLEFPEAAWRGAFRDYREAMIGTSEAPDTAHFAALWATVAARLGRSVRLHYAFPHFPNVYLVNFGTTGDSKTSAARQALKLLPGDGSVKVLRGIGSAEALGDWMQQPENGPRIAHLLFVEELSTLLIRSGWEGSTVLSFMTETFDAPDVYEVPFRKNPVRVEEPTPTLLAGTTPEWFWKSMREIDIHGGFGNRLFFLTGTPKAPIPLPGKPNSVSLERVKHVISSLKTMTPCELALEREAVELWAGFYTAWKATAWQPLTAAAVKRVPAYIMKLVMVYAVLEGSVPVIRADQLGAAIQVGHYGAKCAALLMEAHQLKSRQGQVEARIISALYRSALPAWKIHRTVSGRFSAEDLNRAIKNLQIAGTVCIVGQTRRREPMYALRGRRDSEV